MLVLSHMMRGNQQIYYNPKKRNTMKTINYENYELIIISSNMGTQNNNIAMSIKNNFMNDSHKERTKY